MPVTEVRSNAGGRHPVDLTLVDPGGNPVDLWRTLVSHGVASLPPMRLDEDARTLEVTLSVARRRPRTVRVGGGRAEILGRAPGRADIESLQSTLRYMLRLDEDLSLFYKRAHRDPKLAWVTAGAGRMLRSPTVFEDVIKTICTTNCSWSATQRMVGALVQHLGEPAVGAPASGVEGRAFPTPEAMAAAPSSFYREVVRAGYRAPYLASLARSIAEGAVDLEVLGRGGDAGLSDEEVEARLLALPGIGPYAAAHVMMLVGRYSRLILDSWTRPTYARLVRRRVISDDAIRRRFRRYGPYAGLAFWLFLTRDWVTEPESRQDEAFSQTASRIDPSRQREEERQGDPSHSSGNPVGGSQATSRGADQSAHEGVLDGDGDGDQLHDQLHQS
jgi:3-methyladenine DNA glycosylase/8-oxoguanine DNA glycosylase